MQKRRLEQTELMLSALCYGTMYLGHKVEQADCDRLMDTFRDAGGNFFDTAHCYCSWLPSGAGVCERMLGDYVKRRGCRDQVVLATKGAHPSMDNYRTVERFMSAGRIGADIDDSLSRMRVDSIDLYWLHRDDPRVPVDEILNILNAEVKRGRIRYFGVSNWTAERIDEANIYAKRHNIMGVVANQPCWNLASEAEEPIGAKRLVPGAMLTFSENDIKRHTTSQVAVMPYSPTANGFFAMAGEKPEKYRTKRGLARLGAATAVAGELDATPNQVALAWLLHHPFPVFPILGTGNLDHLVDALGASDLSLTSQQMARLAC